MEDNNEAEHISAAALSGVAPSGAPVGATASRRVLAAGFAGAALSLLPWLDRRAGARGATPNTDPVDTSGDPFGPDTTNASDVTTGGTDSETDPTDPAGDPNDSQVPTGGATDTAAVTTTTAPPKQPTEADIGLLAFAQSVELTIRDLYDVAITGGVFVDSSLDDINAIREAHEGYATAIAGVIGRNATSAPNGVLFGQMQSGFRGDVAAVAAASAALEDTAVATHIDIIGQLVGVDGASLIASIAVIEARHATLLKVLAGATDLADQLANDGVALSPSN